MEAFAAIEGQENPRVLRRDFQEKKRPQRGGGLRPSFHRMAMGHGVRSSLPTDPGRVRSRRIDRYPTLRQPEMNEAANRGGLTSLNWPAYAGVLGFCEPPFEDGYVFPLYEVFEVFHVEPLIPLSGPVSWP